MSLKIMGLDIGRNHAVYVCIDGFPNESVTAAYKQLKPRRLENNKSGVNEFLAVNPDVVILEPTGYWYSQFWVNICEQNNISVFWVSHNEVAAHRKHYGFKNKDDGSDAYTMALLWFDPGAKDQYGQKRFIRRYDHELIDKLHVLYFEKLRLDKTRNATINRFRQRLAVEFPELCKRDFDYISKQGFNLGLGFIAGVCKASRIPKQTVGTGISETSKSIAIELIQNAQYQVDNSAKITVLLQDPEFSAYLKVFKRFGFTDDMTAILLYYSFPLDRFLYQGKRLRDDKGHDLSLRSFQSYLGLSFH